MNRQTIRSLGAGIFALSSMSAMPWVVFAGVTLITATARGQMDLEVGPLGGSYISTGPILNPSLDTGWSSSYEVGTSASFLYGVGYVNDVYVPPSPQIEVAYTLLGDANLDGLVNSTDFAILSANFNQSIAGWDQGDFNYDSLVNATNFGQLAANFGPNGSGNDSLSGDVAALDAFAIANGLLLPAVPEPVTSSLLLIAGVGIMMHRRRKQLAV
jgi:hypothetical protein